MTNQNTQTSRLTFRPCVPEDILFFCDLFEDPVLMRHFHQCRPFEKHETHAFLDSFVKHHQKYGWGPWIIQLKKEPIGLGTFTYYNHDSKTQEGDLFYIIKQSHWGLGYATEFLTTAIDFMFNHTDIKCVRATAMPENLASIRVLEKVGFSFQKYAEENNRNHYELIKLSS